MELNVIKWAETLGQSVDDIERELQDYRSAHPNYTRDKLADEYSSRIITLYTNVGVAGALPSVIPGLGTAAQIALEAGTVSADVTLMLRWMYKMCVSIGLIYNRDVRSQGSVDFVAVLGLWCGVLKAAQPALVRIGGKVAVNLFDKHVSQKILAQINSKVGTTILTKYGTKRGGIALGKLIPFGVGAAVGGGFNYITMKGFKKAALKFYKTEPDLEIDS